MLRFSLFGFPVLIQPGFWLLALIIGLSPERSLRESLTLVGVIFVSVMVHELGHALSARAYGQSPVITLHMMGGLTSWTPTRELSPRRRILVTLAGPMAGFALAGVAFLGLIALSGHTGSTPVATTAVEATLGVVVGVNVFWSAINLVPVLPFDGGQILATALGPSRRKVAATVSLVCGLVTAFALFRMGSLLGALVFGMGGVSSFLAALRTEQPLLPESARFELLARARERLEAQDFAQVQTLARVLLQSARDPADRAAALELVAWAALGAGQLGDARAAVRELVAGGSCDPHLHAAVALAEGDSAEAQRITARALELGDARVELLSLAVRAELECGHHRRAAELAARLVGQVEPAELRQLAAAAAEHGEASAAGRLLEALFVAEKDADDAWSAALAFARAGNADDALRTLSRAVRAGHPSAESAGSAVEFAELALDPRFARALAGDELAVG
ncbi:MAG: site-2 protease family protein [Polyangiaceae bacterium]